MGDLDLKKVEPIFEAIRKMTFDGRPALEAMRDDPIVFEGVRRILREEVEKLLYDPSDDETAQWGNQRLLEIMEEVLSMYGPNPPKE
jgi:hypothetical protein